jgi:hypothetical protein
VLFFGIIWPALQAMVVVMRLAETDRPRLAIWVGIVAFTPYVLLFVFEILVGFLLVAIPSPDGLGEWPAGALVLAVLAVAPWLACRLPGTGHAQAAVADRQERRGATFAKTLPIGTAYFLTLALGAGLPALAVSEADDVRSGQSVDNVFFAWRARPAVLRWSNDASHIRFDNRCDTLRYLGGTSNSRALYDTHGDRAYLIPADQVAVSLAKACN